MTKWCSCLCQVRVSQLEEALKQKGAESEALRVKLHAKAAAEPCGQTVASPAKLGSAPPCGSLRSCKVTRPIKPRRVDNAYPISTCSLTTAVCMRACALNLTCPDPVSQP